jgi:hypothetical protein
MKRYFGLSEFYDDYVRRENGHGIVPIEKIDRLIQSLRDEGYSVRELQNGCIIVRTPEEIKASQDKRKAMQAQAASRFVKLGASFPKETAKRFAEACRILGCTQSGALMTTIQDTINKARLFDNSDTNK